MEIYKKTGVAPGPAAGAKKAKTTGAAAKKPVAAAPEDDDDDDEDEDEDDEEEEEEDDEWLRCCYRPDSRYVLGDVCLQEGSRLSLVSNEPLLIALLPRGSRDRRPWLSLYYTRWQCRVSCVAVLSRSDSYHCF